MKLRATYPVIPAKAGIQVFWTPAVAGGTKILIATGMAP